MHQTGSMPCTASASSTTVPSPSRRLAALVRFGGPAHRPGDLGSILEEACWSEAEGVDAGYAAMLRYRVEEQAFVLQAGVGMHSRRFPAGGRIRAWEAMTGPGVHQLVSVPAPGEGEASFGVLKVGSGEAGEFAQRDLLFLLALAGCMGAAMGRRADQASCADRSARAAERRRAVRDATRAGRVVVLNAAVRHQGRAGGSQQDAQMPAGGD